MIFCFAWANYLLINMVNVKVNIYPNEKADLVIKSSPAIDTKIINMIEEMNVFENIYYIDYVSFRPNHKKMGIFELRKKYKGHYDRFIDSIIEKKVYDKVLIAGYWNDTLYMMNSLWRKGSRFTIDLVEEGELSYEEVWKLYRPYIGSSKKSLLFHKFNTGLMKQYFNRKLTKKLFLYAPERQNDKKIEPISMPKMDCDNPIYEIYKRLYLSLPDWKKVYYSKRTAIFFSNFLRPLYLEDSYKYAYNVIDTILECVSDTKIIIKTHTSDTKHRLEFAKGYEMNTNIYIDRDLYIFEALFSDPSIENKILIAQSSSVLIHPVEVFGLEPYVFLIYKLFPWYKNFGDEIADQYAEALRNLYSRPDKVFVPNTIVEFKMKLEKVYYDLISL